MRNRTAAVLLNTATNYLRYFISAAVMFVLTPFIIRKIGAEDFGLWSLVFSLVGFLGLLDFGLATSVVRYVAECRGSGDRARRNRLVSTLFVSYSVLSVLAAAVALVLSFYFSSWFDIPPERHMKGQLVFLIVALRVALGFPLGLFYGVLFGEQRIHLVNIVQALSTMLYGIATLVVLDAGYGVVALAILNLGAMLIEHVVYLFLAFRKVPDLKVSVGLADRRNFRELASFSVYTFIVNISALVLLRTDPVIVKFFMPLTAVAVYAVAMRISEVALLLTKQFVNVLAPLVAELKASGDDSKIRFVLVNATKFAFAPAVILTSLAYILGTEAVVFWVGPDFVQAGPVLMILMTAMALAIPQMTASGILTMTGDQAYTARAAAISVVINVVASLALVQWLGLLGVALGTLIATLVVDLVLVVRRACSRHAIGYWSYLRRAVLPAVIPAVPLILFTYLARLWIVPSGLLVLAALAVPGTVVYLSVFWWFVEPSEKRLLWERALGRRSYADVASRSLED